jgi:hypothetical protein
MTQAAIIPLRLVPDPPVHVLAWRRAIYSMNCDFNRALNWMCDDDSLTSPARLFRVEAHARETLNYFFVGVQK